MLIFVNIKLIGNMAERVNREVSLETRMKQSAKKQGELNPNYQRPRNSETKQKISQSLQRYWQTIPKNGDKDEQKGF